MGNSLGKTKFISILLTTTVLTGIALWLVMRAVSSDNAENEFSNNIDSQTDLSAVVTPKQMTEPLDDSRSPSQHQSRSEKLIGTWKKQQTYAIAQLLEDFNDNEWHMIVSFTDDGRFIWDSRRTGPGNEQINDSLTGNYSIERGFLIAYQFDKPSSEALERLPMLFAFWPNQLLGKHTFRFKDDYLILGYNGEKRWFYLKRNGLESN
jgi:regulatory protein YycH of two-component signal transduction system YycFG